MGDRLEPAAEAARGVVGENPELLSELGQDLLRHVLGVRVLQFPLPTPAIDVSPVMLHELIPGLLVCRLVAQSPQQRTAGRWKLSVGHE